MDILRDKLNITILFSLFFTLGVISFFTQAQIIFIAIISALLIIFVCKNNMSIKIGIVLFLAFIAGFYISNYKVKDGDALMYFAPRNNVSIEGQVVSILETNKPDRTKFYFYVYELKNGKNIQKDIKSKTIVTLTAPKEIYSKIQIGDKLSLKGNLRTPPKAVNPSQFNYANYLKNENTFTTFYVNKNDFTIKDKPNEFGWKFLQKVDNQRNYIIKKHSQILKSPYLELLGGVVFGNGAINPTDDLKDSFRISGLLHLLAASGLNVGLIFSIWFFIGRLLKINYRINIIIGGLLILVYTCMTGFSPSILRAAFMIEFILFGKLIDRQADNLALISFVCFLMLLFNPVWICSVSFQLSFLVTAGLIIVMPIIDKWCKENVNKCLEFIINTVSVPVIAQLFVLPLQMFYFNSFSSYSIIANILVLPFITIISFVGFISSILAIIPFIPNILIKFCDILLSPFLISTVKISDYISNLPNANFITIQPNIFQVIIYYLILFSIIIVIKKKYKLKMLNYIFVAAILILFASFIKISDKKLHLTFFSVRNADSCLIKTPQNHYFVIDTGKKAISGNYSDGEGIISKYLLSKGIKNIDFIILTHLDNDHIGGTIGLLNKIKTKKIFVNGNIPNTQASKELFDYIKRNKIPYEIVNNNSVLYEENDFKLNAYLDKSIDNDNENSIINLIEYKDFKALFMGDAGIDGFKILPKALKIDVLKLGHHGAQGSINEEVIKNINPKTVIISTGINSYGHPHYSIINLLINTNTKFYRTDEKNAIDISTNGLTISEKCYLPQIMKFEICH